jgi:hypothetical protein
VENENDAPKRFANFGFAAKWAAGITLLCIIVGQGAEQYAAALPPTQGAATSVSSKGSSVDSESVGAIKAATSGPCRD